MFLGPGHLTEGFHDPVSIIINFAGHIGYGNPIFNIDRPREHAVTKHRFELVLLRVILIQTYPVQQRFRTQYNTFEYALVVRTISTKLIKEDPGNIQRELKKLETELKEYKPVGDTQWETKVSEILFTGDRFTGYDVEQLIEPSKFIVEDLPKLQTSIVKKITEKVKSINPEKIVVGDETDIFMDILKNNLSGMSNESMELPGGRTIEFDQDKGTALTMDDSFSVPDKQLTLTRTPAELRKGITDARKCMTILLKANELNDRLADAYDGLASAFDKLVKDVEKSEDSTTKELASKLRSSVVSFTDGMRVDNDRIVAYIGKCLVARISFMRKAIGANKKKSEAK